MKKRKKVFLVLIFLFMTMPITANALPFDTTSRYLDNNKGYSNWEEAFKTSLLTKGVMSIPVDGFALYDMDRDGTPELLTTCKLSSGAYKGMRLFTHYQFSPIYKSVKSDFSYFNEYGPIIPADKNVKGILYKDTVEFGIEKELIVYFSYYGVLPGQVPEKNDGLPIFTFQNYIDLNPETKEHLKLELNHIDRQYLSQKESVITKSEALNFLKGEELVFYELSENNVEKVFSNYKNAKVSTKKIEDPFLMKKLEIGNLEEEKSNILFNGKEVELTSSIIKRENRTFYPFRELLEMANVKVLWESETSTAIGLRSKNNKEYKVEFPIGKNYYKDNGTIKDLPKGETSFLKDGLTYIPIRYAMESLGFRVEWISETNTISISD